MFNFKIIAITDQSDHVSMQVKAKSFSEALARFELNCEHCEENLVEIVSIKKGGYIFE